MTVDIEAARTFIRTNARIVERRLAESYFDGDETAAVAAITGLEAYRNADGGFGHGLEPDVLAPGSQPLGADTALDILGEVARSTSDPSTRMRVVDAVRATMPYLESVSSSDGGLSIVFPSIAAHPRADHWGDGVFAPGLNPTGRIVGVARALGTEHPWLDRAAAFCRAAIDAPGSVGDAHSALCVLPFLDTDTDQDWAATAYDDLCEAGSPDSRSSRKCPARTTDSHRSTSHGLRRARAVSSSRTRPSRRIWRTWPPLSTTTAVGRSRGSRPVTLRFSPGEAS